MTGCATVHPLKQPPIDPVTLYVVDYGIHTAVVLPDGPSRFVEYSFGDYAYAIDDDPSLATGIVAALVSPASGFGRNYVIVDEESGLPAFSRPMITLQRLEASKEKVDEVRDELALRFAEAGPPEAFNSYSGILWRRDSQWYTLAFNNCNHLTRRCLGNLGFDVSGLLFKPDFIYKVGQDVTQEGLKAHYRNSERILQMLEQDRITNGGISTPTPSPPAQ